jgi:uncharacterized protein YvpB
MNINRIFISKSKKKYLINKKALTIFLKKFADKKNDSFGKEIVDSNLEDFLN